MEKMPFGELDPSNQETGKELTIEELDKLFNDAGIKSVNVRGLITRDFETASPRGKQWLKNRLNLVIQAPEGFTKKCISKL
jgi:hypothetical protein